MDFVSAILLGTVQGLTEFLPISSSGHLVLIQQFIPNFSQPGLLFDVILHFGTLFAVLFYFRKKLLKLSAHYMFLIFVGTLPAVVFGFFFREQFELMFKDPKYLGYEFLITAILNFLVDLPSGIKSKINFRNSLIIGVAQATAIIPAISRSGSTIFAAVRLGVSKEKAAEFSFLLSIPAILGANVLELYSYFDGGVVSFNTNYLSGFIASFIVGFFSIRILMKLLRDNKFKIFGYYSLLLGILILLIG